MRPGPFVLLYLITAITYCAQMPMHDYRINDDKTDPQTDPGTPWVCMQDNGLVNHAVIS